MGMKDKLEKIVSSIVELPPFPETALRVMDIANDPNANTNDIVDVILYDQAIVSNCLKMCNSTYFGLREKAKSIKHAVVLIGRDNLIKIVLANCSKMSAFSGGHSGYGLHPGELWRHSVACALISQLLLTKAGKKDSHELFIAALLHDVGKLVIDSFIADDFEAIYTIMKEDNYGFVEAEKEYYGIDHAELGGIISETWQFPKSLTDAIRNHHQGINKESEVNLESWTALSNLVFYIAQGFFSRFQQKDILTYQIDMEMLSCFNLNHQHIEDIAYELPGEMKKARDLLKIPS